MMNDAKRKVLESLVKQMHSLMRSDDVADKPMEQSKVDEVMESASEEAKEMPEMMEDPSPQEAEEDDVVVPAKKKPVTISMMAIKKGSMKPMAQQSAIKVPAKPLKGK